MPDKTARQRNAQSIALAKKTMYKQAGISLQSTRRSSDLTSVKQLSMCSIADLHGDLYSPTTGLGNDVIDKDGKNLVSDTMFRGLLPPELRVMSNHYKTV